MLFGLGRLQVLLGLVKQVRPAGVEEAYYTHG